MRSRALLAGCPTAISHWSGQRRALSATGNSGLRACGAPAPWATAVKVQCMRAKPQTVATSQNKRVRMRRNASFTLGAGVRTRPHITRGPLWWARLKHGIALGALVACRLPAGPALYIPRATSCMCPPFAGRAQHDAGTHGPRVRMHTDVDRDLGVRSGRGGYGGKKPDWKDVKKPTALVIPKPINLPSRRKENNG